MFLILERGVNLIEKIAIFLLHPINLVFVLKIINFMSLNLIILTLLHSIKQFINQGVLINNKN